MNSTNVEGNEGKEGNEGNEGNEGKEGKEGGVGSAQVMVSQMESASDVHLQVPFSAFLELVMDNQNDHAGPKLKTIQIRLDKTNDSISSWGEGGGLTYKRRRELTTLGFFKFKASNHGHGIFNSSCGRGGMGKQGWFHSRYRDQHGDVKACTFFVNPEYMKAINEDRVIILCIRWNQTTKLRKWVLNDDDEAIFKKMSPFLPEGYKDHGALSKQLDDWWPSKESTGFGLHFVEVTTEPHIEFNADGTDLIWKGEFGKRAEQAKSLLWTIKHLYYKPPPFKVLVQYPSGNETPLPFFDWRTLRVGCTHPVTRFWSKGKSTAECAYFFRKSCDFVKKRDFVFYNNRLISVKQFKDGDDAKNTILSGATRITVYEILEGAVKEEEAIRPNASKTDLVSSAALTNSKASFYFAAAALGSLFRYNVRAYRAEHPDSITNARTNSPLALKKIEAAWDGIWGARWKALPGKPRGVKRTAKTAKKGVHIKKNQHAPPPDVISIGEWVDVASYEGETMSWGRFDCASCKRTWDSGLARRDRWQMCKGCDARSMPVMMWLSGEPHRPSTSSQPHDADRCEACHLGECVGDVQDSKQGEKVRGSKRKRGEKMGAEPKHCALCDDKDALIAVLQARLLTPHGIQTWNY